MSVGSAKPLSVFLCHSSADKPKVRELYDRLRNDGVAPWLDVENLLPGQDWNIEITKAVKSADVVIVCLSDGSVTKEGYVQREIKLALDVAQEKLEDAIFIIPLRIEECSIPERLSQKQCVNFFEEDGYFRLMKSLQKRAESVGALQPNHLLRSVQDMRPKTDSQFKLRALGRLQEEKAAFNDAILDVSKGRTNVNPLPFEETPQVLRNDPSLAQRKVIIFAISLKALLVSALLTFGLFAVLMAFLSLAGVQGVRFFYYFEELSFVDACYLYTKKLFSGELLEGIVPAIIFPILFALYFLKYFQKYRHPLPHLRKKGDSSNVL